MAEEKQGKGGPGSQSVADVLEKKKAHSRAHAKKASPLSAVLGGNPLSMAMLALVAGLAVGMVLGWGPPAPKVYTCPDGSEVLDAAVCAKLALAEQAGQTPEPATIYVCPGGEEVEAKANCPPVQEPQPEERVIYVCADGTPVLDPDTCARLVEGEGSGVQHDPATYESGFFIKVRTDIERAARVWMDNNALEFTNIPIDRVPRYVFEEEPNTFISVTRKEYSYYENQAWPSLDGERVFVDLNTEINTLEIKKNCYQDYAFYFKHINEDAPALTALKDTIVSSLVEVCSDPYD